LDGNKTLSIEEQKKMQADLLKLCNKVDMDIAEVKQAEETKNYE
jgi:hypothetical protein